MAGQAVEARGEERETCGRDSGENGQLQAKPKQARVAGEWGYLFPVSDCLIGGRKRLNGAGRGGGARGEEREREKGLVGSLPPSSSSLSI